jgi:hypothetical protein
MESLAQTRLRVATILEDFIEGRNGAWDWDAFLAERFGDQEIAEIQRRCTHLDTEFPPESRGRYCGEQGLKVIRGYIQQLKERKS